jgi:hypothetical protein
MYISERLRNLEEYLPGSNRQSEKSCGALRQDISDARLNDKHHPPSPALPPPQRKKLNSHHILRLVAQKWRKATYSPTRTTSSGFSTNPSKSTPITLSTPYPNTKMNSPYRSQWTTCCTNQYRPQPSHLRHRYNSISRQTRRAMGSFCDIPL